MLSISALAFDQGSYYVYVLLNSLVFEKKVLKKVLLLKSFSFVFEMYFEDVSAMQSGLLRPPFNIRPHLTCFYGNTRNCFVCLKLLRFMT